MGLTKGGVIKGYNAIASIDRLYIVHGDKPEICEKVEEVRKELGSLGCECFERKISGFDLQEVVDAVCEIYNKEYSKDTRFSINITGGTNVMSAGAATGAMITGIPMYYVMYPQDGSEIPLDEAIRSVPTPKIPNVNALKEPHRKILAYLRDNSSDGIQIFNKDVSEGTGISDVMVGRQLNYLAKEGLVLLEKGKLRDRRLQLVSLTREGRMVAKWLMDLRIEVGIMADQFMENLRDGQVVPDEKSIGKIKDNYMKYLRKSKGEELSLICLNIGRCCGIYASKNKSVADDINAIAIYALRKAIDVVSTEIYEGDGTTNTNPLIIFDIYCVYGAVLTEQKRFFAATDAFYEAGEKLELCRKSGLFTADLISIREQSLQFNLLKTVYDIAIPVNPGLLWYINQWCSKLLGGSLEISDENRAKIT